MAGSQVAVPVPRLARAPARPLVRPAPLALAAVALAIAVGAVLAFDPAWGIALLLALLWVPVALLDLPLAIALWLPLVFLADLPGVSPAMRAASLVLVFAWVGTLRVGGGAAIRRHAGPIGLFGLLVAWLAVSLAWAEKPSLGVVPLLAWVTSLLLFAALATGSTRPRSLKVVIAGFVAGVAVSALVGLVVNALGLSLVTYTEEEGRLRGGIGDPNYLAASIVPAIALALGLLATARRRSHRLALLAALLVLGTGLAATGSRGGFVAAGAALVVALVVVRRGRARIAAFGLVLAVAAACFFAATPSVWQHVLESGDRGSGRATMTTVAMRVYTDHPLVGVGLANYTVYAPKYVQQPGSLDYVALIVETEHLLHNAYLQVLVEAGDVGLVLLIALVATCLASALQARRRFERAREHGLASLASAAIVAMAGALTAAAFLPNSSDVQLWLVLATGPALLGLAGRLRPAGREAAP